MLQQKSLLFFLGYKLLLVIYIGWCLAAHNLDILTLVLWIVYGSFIAVFFIFSFLWVDSRQPLQLYNLTPQQTSLLTVFFILTALLCGTTHARTYLSPIFVTYWINHYELHHLHNTEEIESLGWALSNELALATLLISILLTVSCSAAVVILINTKKHKFIYVRQLLTANRKQQHLITASVRRQHFFQQETRELHHLQRTTNYFGGRRT